MLNGKREHRIDEFPLGEQDTPDRLVIPEKLYGRAREIETLLAAFDRLVTSGTPELVLVSGYSGIGKSSVVNELHTVLVPPRGLFASGKFDQYKRDIPYATLAQAFQSLVRRLLGKSDAELSDWRDALVEALGPNGRLMIDLVPELKLIIGDQPPVPELAPQDARRRFQLVFRRLIGVFARPDHPLALLLDDLQWLDAATLDLLEDLLTPPGVPHLLLIGAYRDNEVTTTHPLMRKLEAIRNAGANVREIALANLASEDVAELIADALRCEPERADPLARLVHAKTAGNPFFTIQFISSLAEEGMLTFDHDAARWSWDLDRIHAKEYTDNVVDLMVGKLIRLPAETQQVVQQLACLGNAAAVATLSLVYGKTEAEIHSLLDEAVRADLLERRKDSYHFIHDRIEEAAYLLVPDSVRAEAHLRIGRLLVANTPVEQREEAIYELVSQLNRGAPLITSDQEREQLAELNLIAGKRAKAATAYGSALNYLVKGAAQLPEDGWQRRYPLVFAIEVSRAECEFLTGDLAAAEERLATLSLHAANLVDKAAVACLRAALYTTLARSERAVEICVEYLREAGVACSPRPTDEEVSGEYERFLGWLGGRPIEALFDVPLMSDRDWRATMEVLMELSVSAFHVDWNLRCLVLLRVANLSAEHGNCDGSCYAYGVMIAVVGGRFGDYRAGFRFGQLGLDLVEKKGLDRFKARVYFSCGAAAIPWGRHVRAGTLLLRRGLEIALETGDQPYAAYAHSKLVSNRLTSADPLAEVQLEAESALEFAKQTRFGGMVDIVSGQLGFIRNLRGLTLEFGSLGDDGFDEGRFELRLEASPSFSACWYWICKLQARFYAGDYVQAVAAVAKARQFLQATVGLFEEADYHFYAALARAAAADSATPDARREDSAALAEHHRRLTLWAENCPENFANRAALVGAEIARLDGRELEAERLYEQAIRAAREQGFVQNEGLAYELAARFYAARGFEAFADLYVRQARHCYRRWGADGKVRQLDEMYPHLQEEKERVPAASGTIDAPVEHLDLATVLKVSQAVSGEMVLDKLLETLMLTAIEHTGAQRGLLILQRGNEQRIEAEATISGDSVIVHQKEAAVGGVPESIVQFVTRTREHVILDDAAANSTFSADTYIHQCHARSILCLPLINQAKLIGVLYLENNLTPHVFTPKRIAVLKLLASQAAISLENTRLYTDLEEREAKIRRLVEANIIGIVVWNLEGGIIEANEAFLRMVKYSRGDLVSGRMSWKEITPDKWRAADEQALTELAATGFCEPFEKEYFCKDGSCVSVLVGAALFEGRRDEGVAFVLDLTERKRSEEELRRSEAYLAEAQGLTHTGSWAWSPVTGNIRYWSEECYRVLGFEPAGSPPRFETFFQRIHPDDQASSMERFQKAIREKADFEMDYRIVHPDGETRNIHVVGHPTLGPSGDLREFVGTVIDVTDRKLAEETLRKTQTELAHVARVVTVGELTASIAHEINQPLGALVNNAGACLGWLDAGNLEEARNSVALVMDDAQRASEIITRIRALVKKAPPQKDWLDINQTIREVFALAQSEVQRNHIALETQLSDDMPVVFADRIQLQQVMLNLMMNAIEAMTQATGPRELLISSGADDSKGVVVVVRDSGPGLDSKSLERLFEPFYTTKPQGMGMGLAICRSIIEAHGGRLWATTNEDRGATFHFTLPIVEETQA